MLRVRWLGCVWFGFLACSGNAADPDTSGTGGSSSKAGTSGASGGSGVTGSDTQANGGAADAAQPLPECRWPASLDGGDTPAACRAARAYLSCTYASGITIECLSEDGTRCTDSGQGEVPLGCTDQCASDEYGLVCGRIGPPLPGDSSVDTTPPDTCRLKLPTPGGIAFYCCPCD